MPAVTAFFPRVDAVTPSRSLASDSSCLMLLCSLELTVQLTSELLTEHSEVNATQYAPVFIAEVLPWHMQMPWWFISVPYSESRALDAFYNFILQRAERLWTAVWPSLATLARMDYNVYTVEYFGVPRDHKAIFVRISDNESGTIYHVTGSLMVGMKYEKKPRPNPETSATYVPGSKVLVGTVKEDDMGRFEEICEGVPAPTAQIKLGGKRIDSSTPLRTCREWVGEAVAQLLEQGLVVES